MAQLLIDKGADINATQGNGGTPLISTIVREKGGPEHQVKLLLQNGANRT
jgi:ankyrin repeat protein